MSKSTKSAAPRRVKAEPNAPKAKAAAPKAEPAPEPATPTDSRDAKFDAIGADAVRENLANGRYTDVRADRARAWLARQG